MKKKLALTLATIATLGSFLTGCGENLETEAVTQVQAQCDSYVEAVEDGMKESDFSGTYKVSNSKLVLISDGENSEILDDGTIKDDGTITFSGEDDGVKYSMDFKLQK